MVNWHILRAYTRPDYPHNWLCLLYKFTPRKNHSKNELQVVSASWIKAIYRSSFAFMQGTSLWHFQMHSLEISLWLLCSLSCPYFLELEDFELKGTARDFVHSFPRLKWHRARYIIMECNVCRFLPRCLFMNAIHLDRLIITLTTFMLNSLLKVFSNIYCALHIGEMHEIYGHNRATEGGRGR